MQSGLVKHLDEHAPTSSLRYAPMNMFCACSGDPRTSQSGAETAGVGEADGASELLDEVEGTMSVVGRGVELEATGAKHALS